MKSLQIFYLPDYQTIILFILLWTAFQGSVALASLRIKDSHFSCQSFLYRSRSWEKNGEIYQRIFKVRSWKRYLPDAGELIKGGYSKRHLNTHTKEHLEKFLIESCRAELAHMVSISPFWVFGFFAPARVILVVFLYSVAVNLPCIIAQRYNRPRIIRLLQGAERSEIGM